MKKINLGRVLNPEVSFRHRVDKSITWGKEHERTISTAAFLGGFGIDLLTLNRIDQAFDNLILASYLLIALVSIVIMNVSLGRSNETAGKIQTVALYATQFAFGGLLSGFVIFYTKSASWYVAWPFLIALYAAFVSNDRLRHMYKRLEFQITALFVALFSLTIFWVPILTRQIGDLVFILSGIVAVTVIILVLSLLYSLIPNIALPKKKRIRANIFVVFFVFNILYFTNIIPPIPLSLKQIDVYYDVVRSGDNQYTVKKQKYPWYDLSHLWNTEYVRGITTQDRAHVLTSVFGPQNLVAPIEHHWQKYDPVAEVWNDVLQSDFTIVGGRDGGFRWYSFVDKPSIGMWRVITISNRKELGRVNFEVVGEYDIELETEII